MDKGLRQGCVLSPLLFNMYVNGICQRLDDTECGVMHSMQRVQDGGSDWKREDAEEDSIAVSTGTAAVVHDNHGLSNASLRRAQAWREMRPQMRVASLWYADDIALIGDSAEELQGLLDTLGEECANWRILLNESKTCVMVMNATI
jgi:hypothetical protein